jgi:hypothetical protein
MNNAPRLRRYYPEVLKAMWMLKFHDITFLGADKDSAIHIQNGSDIVPLVDSGSKKFFINPLCEGAFKPRRGDRLALRGMVGDVIHIAGCVAEIDFNSPRGRHIETVDLETVNFRIERRSNIEFFWPERERTPVSGKPN